MKLLPAAIVPAGLTLALWLALRMPDGDFLSRAWMPAAAWVVFAVMASAPSLLARAFRVDDATYGPVAFIVGSAVPAVGAVLAAAALLVARHAAEASPTVAEWASSPLLGAAFVLILLFSITSVAVLGHRSIGAAGQRPIVDPRPTVISHPDPPRSAAQLGSDPGSAGSPGSPTP